jgi:tripartite-type tricarboxylate transporter receptor subunit TctC
MIALRARCALALFALLPTAAAWGQGPSDYPTRPITLIVPFSTGTGIDILARTIGPKLSERWGQPVVVDNKPGASGNIGSEFVAKAAPNGYTLMVTVNTFVITPSLYKSIPYDVVNDFAPISKIALASYALAVNPTVLPANNLADVIAAARAKPGELNFASPGRGTPHHLGMEFLKQRLGLDMVHVPYKGFAGAMTDLASGQVQMMFTLVHSALPQARAGRIKIVAVTGPNRSPFFPEAPTFREQGITFMDDVDAWYAVLAPAKTPSDIIAKLNREINAIMELPDVRTQLMNQGMVPVTSTPAELGALVKSDLARWAKVVADAHIAAE